MKGVSKIPEEFAKFIKNIATSIKKFGAKTVVQSVLITLSIIIVLLIIGAFINKSIYNQFKTRDNNIKIEHQENWIKSREFYSHLKSNLKTEMYNLSCQGILLMEYHNGVENITTGMQFCKFDIILVIQNPSSGNMCYNDYIDESIYKYDIFMSDNYSAHKINIFDTASLKQLDRHFYYIINEYNPQASVVVLATLTKDNLPIGNLIFIFEDPNAPNYADIINCTYEVENFFKKNT